MYKLQKIMLFPACALLCAMTARPTPAQIPSAQASLDGLTQKPTPVSPLTNPMLSDGAIQLIELESKFAQDVAKGGGKAFANWFADDAVTLNNGQPVVHGKLAIAAKANWDPKEYQLSWTPEGAQMGSSNDMGFTWGHYEGRSKDKNGQAVTIAGRYITIWKKMPDGEWKVVMDASANEPPAAGECCVVPKP